MSEKPIGKSLAITPVPIDQHCTGSRWEATDMDLLARLVAIVAMGQATHAVQIINELTLAEPASLHEARRTGAKRLLTKHRDHRDGWIFEVISWIAAQQESAGTALLRDPHTSATTQGLDGLMIEMDASSGEIKLATIFEDKCSDNPRAQFLKIITTFKEHHANKRAIELTAAAAALLKEAGLGGTRATKAADRVLDKVYRAYRGSLAVTLADDCDQRRQKLFKGYKKLDGINAQQRLGAVLITGDDLRAWFEELAKRAIDYIDSLSEEVC